MSINTIGILTSGGDAPGMNAAIRAVVRSAVANGIQVLGIRRGYNGLINGDTIELNARSVDGIQTRGGTMLYTARCREFITPEGQKKAADICREQGIRLGFFGDEQRFGMGDGEVRLMNWQKVPEPYSMNDRSAQFMITYGDCSMLIMSDIERSGMRVFFDAVDPSLLSADILRYPHHGKEAMWNDVYDAIAPELVLISGQWVGPMANMGARFLRHEPADKIYTSRGIVKLTTDGKHWVCEKLTEKEFLAAAREREKTAEENGNFSENR